MVSVTYIDLIAVALLTTFVVWIVVRSSRMIWGASAFIIKWAVSFLLLNALVTMLDSFDAYISLRALAMKLAGGGVDWMVDSAKNAVNGTQILTIAASVFEWMQTVFARGFRGEAQEL